MVSDSKAGYTGDSEFTTAYTTGTPSIEIYLENAANFTRTDTFGTVSIILYGMKQLSELERTIYEVRLNVTVNPTIVDTEGYEASITSGKQYGVFGTTNTMINHNSSFSVSYSLTSEQHLFADTTALDRILVSDYVLPENTILTLIDLSDKLHPKEYYYKVSSEDITNQKSNYNLADFISVGSITGEHYDNATNYYSNNTYNEQFIVIVDFYEALDNVYEQEHSFTLETHDISSGQNKVTKVNNNDTIEKIKYTVVNNDITFDISDTKITTEVIRPSENLIVDIVANMSAAEFKDTTLFDLKMGLKLSLSRKNKEGIYEKLSGNELIDKYITIDNQYYYPNMNGDYFVKLNDNVVNVLKTLSLNNQTVYLDSGQYKLHIDLINSYTGVSNVENASGMTAVEKEFVVKDESYGLKVTTNTNSRIYHSMTGKDLDGNEKINLKIEYSSNLANPKLRLKILKLSKGGTDYLETSINEVLNNNFIEVANKEYLVADTLDEIMNIDFDFIDNVGNGSYKFIFELYDDTTYIGQHPLQILVKD